MKKLGFSILLLLVPSVAAAHGVSKSYADWTIDGDRASVRVSFAAHDVLAAVAGLDANADKAVSAAELDAMRDAIAKRIVRHTEIRAGRDSADTSCSAEELPIVRGIGDPVEEIQVTASFACASGIGALSVRSTYLPELEPPHATLATFSSGSNAAQHVFTPDTPPLELTFDVKPLADELFDALMAGLKANLTWAPMLFCLGLLLSRRGRGMTLVLGAFVLAHAVVVLVGGPRLPFIPLVAALGVAWIGLETLVSSVETKPGLHYVAFAVIFGIVFGVLAGARAPREPLLKLGFVVGSTGPLLLSFLAGRVLLGVAGSHLGRALRAVGGALIGAGVVLLVLHFIW